jgi:hypothetical protein
MMATIVHPDSAPSYVVAESVSDVVRFVEDQVRRQCVKFVLAQRTGDALHTVNDWPVSEMLDAATLAHAIHATANREAQVLRESIVYGVFAFRADQVNPVARCTFRADGGGEWLSSGKTPDERGLVAMLMQHTDTSARLSLGHSREIVDQYQTLLTQRQAHDQRLLEQAYARIRVLEEREMDSLELREKLQSHAAERDAQLESLRRQDEMRKFAMEKLGPVVPILMAKLLGANPANETGAPKVAAAVAAAVGTASAAQVGDELVDRLMQSLTPAQLGEVARLLTPEQLALFGELYELAEARIQKSRAASSPAQPAPPAAATAAAPADTAEPSTPTANPQPPASETKS